MSKKYPFCFKDFSDLHIVAIQIPSLQGKTVFRRLHMERVFDGTDTYWWGRNLMWRAIDGTGIWWDWRFMGQAFDGTGILSDEHLM